MGKDLVSRTCISVARRDGPAHLLLPRSLAATIFQIFVAADNASDTLTQLKRIHGMMPYFMLRGILKVSNPMAMIRGVLDLFLARPFGGQSLIQRSVGECC